MISKIGFWPLITVLAIGYLAIRSQRLPKKDSSTAPSQASASSNDPVLADFYANRDKYSRPNTAGKNKHRKTS